MAELISLRATYNENNRGMLKSSLYFRVKFITSILVLSNVY